MNSLELINKLYKPYKIEKCGKCTIIYSTSGNYVIKEKTGDIKKTYSYLKSRGFNYYPSLVDDTKEDINIFEYKENLDYPKEQRASDLIDTIINLHQSTIHYKEVRQGTFKSIYEKIESNLNYYQNYYDEFSKIFEKEVFMSPSHYLFMRNISKLFNQINFCKSRLDIWYENVKDLKQYKVCQVHNNLRLSHFLKGERNVLISWDKSLIDSPVIDLYILYKNEALNLEFKNLFDKYLNSNIIDENEKELLFILICMPVDMDFMDEEINSCISVGNSFDYIFKTEELIKPYYSGTNNDEDDNFNN